MSARGKSKMGKNNNASQPSTASSSSRRRNTPPEQESSEDEQEQQQPAKRKKQANNNNRAAATAQSQTRSPSTRSNTRPSSTTMNNNRSKSSSTSSQVTVRARAKKRPQSPASSSSSSSTPRPAAKKRYTRTAIGDDSPPPPHVSTTQPLPAPPLPSTATTVPSATANNNSTVKQTPAVRSKSTAVHALPTLDESKGGGGTVLAVGQNTMSQLGLKGSIQERQNPQPVLLPEPVIQIAAGPLHSVCLTDKGSVFTFGCNDEHALGRKNEAEEEDEEALPLGSVDLSKQLGDMHNEERVVQVVAGDSHTVILTNKGRVFGWGTYRSTTNGIYGLVKKGRMAEEAKEIQGLPESIVKLASGYDFVLFLGQSGTVYSSGNGEAGQLGRLNRYVAENGRRGGIERLISPQKINYLRPRGLTDKRPIVFEDIFASAHSFFLKARNHNQIILAGGLNNYQQLGIDTAEPVIYFPCHVESLDGKKWKKFAGGLHHTLALTEDGEVYAMGRYHEGQLGIPNLTTHLARPTLISSGPTPADTLDIACGNHVSFIVDKQGKVWSFGAGTSLQHGHGSADIPVPTLMSSKYMDTKKIQAISVGAQHTLFLSLPD